MGENMLCAAQVKGGLRGDAAEKKGVGPVEGFPDSGFFREGEDLFIRAYDYVPSLPEIAVGLLPVGLLIFIIAAACALFVMIPEAWQKQTID